MNHYWRITTTFSVVVMLLFFVSCRDSNKDFVAFEFDPELVPTMTTTQVNMLISEEGTTRMRALADVWEMFDRATEPHWFFPEGIYVEEFDSLFTIVTTIKADTAWNFTAKELWQLRGNVKIVSISGDEFETEELFMSQSEERFFSDKYIEIRREDGTIIRGTGFESNQSMTEWTIRRPHDSRFPFVEATPITIEPFDESELEEDPEENEIEEEE
ncbi:MAG: LPS export ABC transporter periplasmic protein LptC [Dysgonamonadaceae bacterium]|nr:LPS export ABC transporter periplasmic protein LptC [Dysgonamonadaceae bacterium]